MRPSPDASRPDPGSPDGEVEDDSSPTPTGDASAALPEGWVPPTKPVSLNEFLDAHFDKVCAWVKRCSGRESCDGAPDRLEEPRHMREAIPPEIAAGRLAYDPEEGLRCLQAKLGCGERTDFARLCGPVFRGRVELGGECYSPAQQYECAEGACLGSSCPGRCKLPAVPHQDGEACSQGTCKEGSICDVHDARGLFVCGPERGEGESCDEQSACSAGLHCSNGKCAEHITHGAECAYDHECAPTDVCRYYDGTRVCQTVVPLGSPCRAGLTVCEHNTTCVETWDAPRTCRARAKLGAQCPLAQCRVGLTCDEERNVCVIGSDLGAECTTFCSFPLRCIEGVCRNVAGLGESCDSAASCRSDLYCDSEGVCRKPGGAWADCDPAVDGSCDSFQHGCLPRAGADAGTKYACRPRCEGPDSVTAPDDAP